MYVIRASQCQHNGLCDLFDCLSLFSDMHSKRWRIHTSPSSKIAYNLFAVWCLKFYFPKISGKITQNDNKRKQNANNFDGARESKREQKSCNVFTKHSWCMVVSLWTMTSLARDAFKCASNLTCKIHKHAFSHVRTYSRKGKTNVKSCCFVTCWGFCFFTAASTHLSTHTLFCTQNKCWS